MTRFRRPLSSAKRLMTAEAYARQLVRRGRTEDARKLVSELPPGVMVIEINETTPDEALWPRRRG